MIIITEPRKQKSEWNDISDNPDREYMEECAKVDRNRPLTWKAYENVPMAIIDMEYNELKNAKTEEDKIENLYHLSVACLNMWRHLNEL
jgi:hypothetical protein